LGSKIICGSWSITFDTAKSATDEKLLFKLLSERQEKDWLEFKGKLKLYQSDGNLVPQQWDEFLKDIFGLVNGNSHIIRKTKYLIIGANDKNFDEDGCRILYDVDYKIPTASDMSKWLASACRPAIVGLESEIVPFRGIDLFVITVPPTFHLHETTRELKASGGTFQKHTVFMRQDENTIPASVDEGQTIKHLKLLHRQEIANPSSSWIGIIAGRVVGFIIGGARLKAEQITSPVAENVMRVMFVVLGVAFGGMLGWFAKQWNETRYDWQYMGSQQRIAIVFAIIVSLLLTYFVSYLVR
jgi:hypothetical protein